MITIPTPAATGGNLQMPRVQLISPINRTFATISKTSRRSISVSSGSAATSAQNGRIRKTSHGGYDKTPMGQLQ